MNDRRLIGHPKNPNKPPITGTMRVNESTKDMIDFLASTSQGKPLCDKLDSLLAELVQLRTWKRLASA